MHLAEDVSISGHQLGIKGGRSSLVKEIFRLIDATNALFGSNYLQMFVFCVLNSPLTPLVVPDLSLSTSKVVRVA